VKPSLQLKISQHLALTPQLQQSIRLLQLSTLELNQELEQVLSDNPLLERTDDPLAGALRISASGTLESPQSASAPEARGPDGAVDTTSERSERTDDGGDGGSGGDGDDRFGEWSPDGGGRGAGSGEDEDERTMLQVASTGRTLRDHLSGQLSATRCEPRDRALVELLTTT